MYRAYERGPYAHIPTVILVDRGTASAGELLTGALFLWYEDTIHIVGERTYGKGAFSTTSQEGGVEFVLRTGGFVAGELGRRDLQIHGSGILPTVFVEKPDFPLTPLEPRYDVAAQTGLWILGETTEEKSLVPRYPLRQFLLK